MKFLKKLPLWGKILVALIVLIIFFIGSIFIFFFAMFYEDNRVEKIIDKKFHEEITRVPELKVISFDLWEGDSAVSVEVDGKGRVGFWYGKSGIPRITSFGGYGVGGECFYMNEQGLRGDYVFNHGIVLDKDSNLKKWFPFEVNNLTDLVNRYDDIAVVLSMFPTNPEMTDINNVHGGGRVKNPNPEYFYQSEYKDKDILCDLYRY